MIYILCTALCYREGQRRPDSTHLRSSRWPGWDLWGGLGLGSRSLALLADRLLSGTSTSRNEISGVRFLRVCAYCAYVMLSFESRSLLFFSCG